MHLINQPVFLGIDPGLHGALAFFTPSLGALCVLDMPTHTILTSAKKKRTMLDLHYLNDIIQRWMQTNRIAMAVVEDVGAMPGQGVSSVFSFGFSAGATQMAVIANGIPIHLVRPAIWKKAMRITADKSTARREASRLMPKHADNWQRVKDDGRAEAALLAYYLARTQVAMPAEPALTLADVL